MLDEILDHYLACERCGDENSETKCQECGVVCEPCYNAEHCGCEICKAEAPEPVATWQR
ncbi:hypothetical protein UFOVP613_13 [uncultured Caudovirales phage]|uniref:Uncharacterized protein n=1 Tax=uncultured Caudovirales phage TaxID=2100421 RepID=A0A6J5N568_9CAUD|nr:hypothetical protein UFOVP613_13 [uncultured Caudovirales phage]